MPSFSALFQVSSKAGSGAFPLFCGVGITFDLKQLPPGSWANSIPMGELLEEAWQLGMVDASWKCSAVCGNPVTGKKDRGKRAAAWREGVQERKGARVLG